MGICYQDSNGKVFYKSSLRKELSETLFRDRKDAVGNLAKHACEYAARLIKGSPRISDEEIAPGIYLGDKKIVEGYDLNEMHSRVLRKVSFFSYLDFYKKASEHIEDKKGFSEFVKDRLLERKSNLVGLFDKQFRVLGAMKNFDFADNNGGFAANFYVFQKNSRIYKAEVSCLDLSMIKEHYKKVSLVVMVDFGYNSKSKRLRGYKEVEGVANHLDVAFKVVESTDEAADYLQENVA
ncbi:hypothetical protein [Halomonas getboli]|uniref:hypothetical protein n=1 Tax=Halomonas getboli TaxID=2935862 RepID=UPI001FFF59AB|nr:hypothetical protein [Halomonas getboli]MCK2184674.1 hypothetical protein [Halomonas getboli]